MLFGVGKLGGLKKSSGTIVLVPEEGVPVLNDEDFTPEVFFFNGDGTEITFLQAYNADVFTLSEGYNLKSANVNEVEYPNFGGAYTIMRGSLCNSGSTFTRYEQSSGAGVVYNEPLSTAYDITSHSVYPASGSSGVDLGHSSFGANRIYNLRGAQFNSDGTKLYVVGTDYLNIDKVMLQEYTCSTAYDLFTISFSSKRLILSSSTYSPDISCAANRGVYLADGFCLAPDDKTFVLVGSDGSGASYQDFLATWEMSTASDLSTASLQHNYDLKLQSTDSSSWSGGLQARRNMSYGRPEFSPNGTRFYFSQLTEGMIYQFELETAFDISTAYWDGDSAFLNNEEDIPVSNGDLHSITEDGLHIYVTNTTARKISHYTMTSPYALYTVAPSERSVTQTDAGSNIYAMSCPIVSNNGQIVHYLMPEDASTSNDYIYQGTLSTPYDLSTMADLTTRGADTYPSATRIKFNNNGTKLFVGTYNDGIFEYDLSTAYDVTTRSASANYNLAIADIGGNKYGYGWDFNSDGTKIVAMNRYGDDYNVIPLSTAYDLSTYGTYTTRTAPVISDSGFDPVNQRQGWYQSLTMIDDENAIVQRNSGFAVALLFKMPVVL